MESRQSIEYNYTIGNGNLFEKITVHHNYV